jgi:hypothetical protein
MRGDRSNDPHGSEDRRSDAEPATPGAGSARPDADRETAEDDLRATGDSIRADAGRLAAVEDDKGALAVDDPQFDRLSDEAVELASRIARETRAERQPSQEID